MGADEHESEKPSDEEQAGASRIPIWMVIGQSVGVSVGVSLGVTQDNLGLWLPLGIAIGSGMGLAAALVWNAYTAPPDPTRCPHCDYSMKGLTTTTCPECGLDTSAESDDA